MSRQSMIPASTSITSREKLNLAMKAAVSAKTASRVTNAPSASAKTQESATQKSAPSAPQASG